MFGTTAGVGGYAAMTGTGSAAAVLAGMSSIVYALGRCAGWSHWRSG